MTKDEALRLALEALETSMYPQQKQLQAITAIKSALEAKDEPVPVAIVEVFGKDWRLDYMALPVGKHKLYAQQYTYTTLSQRKPLTDEEIKQSYRLKCMEFGHWLDERTFLIACNWAEAKLKEKNT
jgi:hypothetical protein